MAYQQERSKDHMKQAGAEANSLWNAESPPSSGSVSGPDTQASDEPLQQQLQV